MWRGRGGATSIQSIATPSTEILFYLRLAIALKPALLPVLRLKAGEKKRV